MICLDPKKSNNLLFIGTSFTQKEYLIGHKFGVSIFSSNDGSTLAEIKTFGGVGLCASPGGPERLAIVGTHEERTLSDEGKAQSIPDQNFNIKNPGPRTVALVEGDEVKGLIPMPTQIVNLKMTAKHLIVVLEYSVEVYELNEDFSGGVLRLREETQQNLFGACDVTADGMYLLIPGKEFGSLEMYSLESFTLKSKSNSNHSHSVAALAASNNGSFVASGSTRSVEARFGKCEESVLKMDLRFKRGTTWSQLTALAFSRDDKYFGLGSDSEKRTFHFYSTEKGAEGITNWVESWAKREARKEIGNFTATTTGLIVFLPVDEEECNPFTIVTQDLGFYAGWIRKDMSFEPPELKKTLKI